jgi:hypothetical protein
MSCGKTYSERKEQTNVFQTKQTVDDSKAILALQLLVEALRAIPSEAPNASPNCTVTRSWAFSLKLANAAKPKRS